MTNLEELATPIPETALSRDQRVKVGGHLGRESCFHLDDDATHAAPVHDDVEVVARVRARRKRGDGRGQVGEVRGGRGGHQWTVDRGLERGQGVAARFVGSAGGLLEKSDKLND